MATTWLPYTVPTGKWLLDNNEVIDTPALEITQTGRKMRISGQQDTAMFSKNLERLLRTAASTVAEDLGTKVYGPHLKDIELKPGPDSPPFEGVWEAQWEIADEMVDKARGTIAVIVRAAGGNTYRTRIQISVLGTRSRVDGYGPRGTPLATRDNFKAQPFRAMAQEILDLANYLEEEISIPISFENMNRGLTRRYRMVRTNLSNDVLTQLRETMVEGSALSDAFVHLKAFRRSMLQAGFALPNPDNDMLTRLEHGRPVQIQFKPGHNSPDLDKHHSVTIEPLTGEMTIRCGNKVNRDDLANAWEQQRLIAELTGEEEAFLGFCRANQFRI